MNSETRHDERCPNCKRFVPRDADGYYDTLTHEDDDSYVYAFCNEACADAHATKRRALKVPA